MRLLSQIRCATSHVLRFLLPWACAGCRTPLDTLDDTGFCGRCWLELPRIQGWVCRACGVPLKDGGNLCFPCRRKPPGIRIRAAVTYAGALPQAIHRFKYAGRKSLARPFSVLMRYAWGLYPELLPVDALVAVPLYPASFRERGYNQAALLAEFMSPIIGRVLIKNALIRTRKTKSQVGLSKTDRLNNLKEAFHISPVISSSSLKGLHLLLIDDVCTTAATLSECSKALKKAGAASVKAFVLARDV
jgi:ComF family protein